MRNIRWRLMIALLTFGVGVSVAMWFVSRSYQQTEETEKTVFVIDAALSGDSESADIKDEFYEVGGMIVTTDVGCITTKDYRTANGTQAVYQSYFFESRRHAEREMRRLIREGAVIKCEAVRNNEGKSTSEVVTVKLKEKDTTRFATYQLSEDEIVILKTRTASSLEMLERFTQQVAP